MYGTAAPPFRTRPGGGTTVVSLASTADRCHLFRVVIGTIVLPPPPASHDYMNLQTITKRARRRTEVHHTLLGPLLCSNYSGELIATAGRYNFDQ